LIDPVTPAIYQLVTPLFGEKVIGGFNGALWESAKGVAIEVAQIIIGNQKLGFEVAEWIVVV